MIYIDLDGVLSDLDGYISSYEIEATQIPAKFFEFAVAHYKELFREPRIIRENLDILPDRQDYRILSALPNYEGIFKVTQSHQLTAEILREFRKAKIEWCFEKLGIPAEKVIIVSSWREKCFYAKPGDTLYDDKSKTIELWEKSGGIGKLVKGSK